MANLVSLSSPIVQVDVGGRQSSTSDTSPTERQVFHVHKAVLCKTSGFLQAALKPEWQGPEPRPVDLTDEDPTTFKMYLPWLYSGKVSLKPYTEKSDTSISGCSEAVARSSVLGAKLMASAFQNAVLMAFIDCLEYDGYIPSHHAIRTIYKGTEAGSPARKLMVDFWVCEANDTWARESDIDNVADTVGTEFANELIIAFIADRSRSYSIAKKPYIKEPEQYMIKDTCLVGFEEALHTRLGREA
jgi:hypothetical protein